MGERRIARRYELVEQLGTLSWRAMDTDLEREVFVRMPGRDVSAAWLTHHGIVPLFDQGEDAGVPYAVYEYLAGGSLERRLAAGPLSETEVDRVATNVTAALAYAQEQGVTHGSIPPPAPTAEETTTGTTTAAPTPATTAPPTEPAPTTEAPGARAHADHGAAAGDDRAAADDGAAAPEHDRLHTDGLKRT